MKKEIYVYGHKNPDTDSICAAIGLATLKNLIVEKQKTNQCKFCASVANDSTYIPMAAGEPNSETAYVLDAFNVKAPKVEKDIRRQICDIEIKDVISVLEGTTIKKAWEIMHQVDNYTIPVKDESGSMVGLITIGDIARAYMDARNNTEVTNSGTTFENIAQVLDGQVVAGDAKTVVKGGKVNIAAANKELMAINIDKGDIAILSDDEKSQKYLIEKGVACMIISNGVKVSEEIVKLAKDNNVAIITTNCNTYRVARMINQSQPVKYLMQPLEDVCSFNIEDYIDDIISIMTQKRFREFPVINHDGTVAGMITKTSLIDMPSKQVIMVDHNELSQAVFGLFDADVVEIVDHHKLGTVETLSPITVTNKPLGSTSTIVYQMYKEFGVELPKDVAGLLCSAILSDTMLFKSPTCTKYDKQAADEIAEYIGLNLDEHWQNMLRASLDLDSKTEKEIFYQDYKQFKADGFTFGAGQVLAANQEDVDTVKARMIPYLSTAIKEEGIDMVCLMVTDVSAESTDLIFFGENAKAILESAFEVKGTDDSIYLEGVVSRKKQLIPPIMEVLQQ